MTLLINLIGFLTFFYLLAYLPGRLISKKLKIKSFWDLDLFIGLTVLGSALFFGRWFAGVNIILLSLLAITLFFSFKNQKRLIIKIPELTINYWLVLSLLLGVIAQSLPYIISLAKGEPFISFDIYSSHDQAWHASLIYELVKHFPPQIPGFSGVILKNYHYLYDLLLAANLKLFKLNLSYLLQGIYPIVISLFFGLSIYRVTTHLTKDKLTPILAVFFGYFANNLSFLQHFFNNQHWQISDLIFDQPIIYLFNHQTVLSISMVLYLSLLLSKINLKKLDIKKAILVSLGLTSLIILKIYAFLVLVPSLTIYWIFNPKQKNLFLILFFTGLLSLVYIALTFNLGGKFIDFNPGWVAEAFFDKTLAPLFPKLHGLQMIWQQQESNLKLSILKALSLALLLLSSFHLRLIGIFSFNKNHTPIHKLLFLISITSILLTLIGNQVSSAYNIVQFMPYAITITTITSLIAIEYFPKRFQQLYLFLFFLISLTSACKPIVSMAKVKYPVINTEKINILTNLNTLPNGVVISFIEADNHMISIDGKDYYSSDFGNNLLSSVSRQRSFYADQKQLIVLGLNYPDRLKIIDQLNNHFCQFTPQDKQVINQYNLKYFLTKNNQPCNDPSLEIIESNKNLVLYKYNE